MQCTFVYPLHISLLMLFYPPIFPSPSLFSPSGTLFRSLSSRSSISPGLYPARSMLSYPTDNSIILHAKTASDVLAQSASHLCEQITSYRKTDFIFKEERGGSDFFFFFFLFIHATRPTSSFSPSISRSLVFLYFFFVF